MLTGGPGQVAAVWSGYYGWASRLRLGPAEAPVSANGQMKCFRKWSNEMDSIAVTFRACRLGKAKEVTIFLSTFIGTVLIELYF